MTEWYHVRVYGEEIVSGRKASIAHYDIFVDKVDDMLWLGTKKGKVTYWIETFTKFTGGW